MGRVRNEFDSAVLGQLSVEAAGLNLYAGHLTLMKWCGRAPAGWVIEGIQDGGVTGACFNGARMTAKPEVLVD